MVPIDVDNRKTSVARCPIRASREGEFTRICEQERRNAEITVDISIIIILSRRGVEVQDLHVLC